MLRAKIVALASALLVCASFLSVPAAAAHALSYVPSGSPYNWSDGAADGWTLATSTTVQAVNTSYHRLSGDGTAAFDAVSPSYSPLATVTGGTVTFCSGGPYVVDGTNSSVSLVSGGTSYPGTISNGTSGLPTQCANIGTDHYATVSWSGLSLPSGASVAVRLNSYVSGSGLFLGNVAVSLTTSSVSPTPTGTPSSGGGSSGGGSTGALLFPTLNLAAVSSSAGSFFSFLAPALWVIVGISLGGIIVSRVRNLL